MKRLTLILVLLSGPMLVAATLRETGKTETVKPAASFIASAGDASVEWQPIAGPADSLPAVTTDDSAGIRGLTVHEWGTFTSVAGPDGLAMDWLPAGGPTDLPCFVSVSGAGPKGLALTDQGGRSKLAKVRMETPVLYFYAPEAQSVYVKVRFPHGLITEWYPPQAELNPSVYDVQKAFPDITGTITWNNVKVAPGATASYPYEDSPSHYYAARRTNAAPLEVAGKFEKFLFYRGIASFTPPIAARIADPKIIITNMAGDPLPAVILFEKRGSRIGYRMFKNVEGTIHVEAPELNATFSSLQGDLESLLRSQGMFALEARAMVETWRDSWFEQGSRIFYITPSQSVDSILPLEVMPKPISIARAFVGRMELASPTTQQEVRRAIAENDRSTLATYGRFLEPIVARFVDDLSSEDRQQAMEAISSNRSAYVASAMACSKARSW